MTKIFFTPGPSQIFPSVATHLKNALKKNIFSISHRSKKFHEIFSQTSYSLRKLLNVPNNYSIFFLSSGTESMERVLENCVRKYSFHFVNGAFSERFFKTACQLKKKAIKKEVDWGEGFDFKSVAIPRNTEMICFTQNETSTGVALRVEDIYQVKKTYPQKLIAVDTVSSSPYANIDYSKIDCGFFSVQKGFGLPAGLAVMVVSPRALAKASRLDKGNFSLGSYHSFLELQKYAEKNETPETPNVLAIYLLGKVAHDMMKVGIDKIRKDTEAKAKLLYDFLANNKKFKPFVTDVSVRSQTVIVADIAGVSEKVIKLLGKQGVIVGAGYGKYKESQIRIANFPSISKRETKRLIKLLKRCARGGSRTLMRLPS